MFVYSNTELYAENEGEAVGMIYGYINNAWIIKFMCERKLPESASLLSDAFENWMYRNRFVVSKLADGLARTPVEERMQMDELAKQIRERKIILFNGLSESEKENTCSSLASKLDSDSYKQEMPNAYKFMSK